MTIIISTSPSQKQKETLGKFLKQKRIQNKKSVQALAALICRSPQYYYRLEKGEAGLDANIIRRLFDEYNVKYDKPA